MRVSSRSELDSMLIRLSGQKDAWVNVAIPERIAILEQCIERTTRVAKRWVEAGCAVKGLDPNSSLAGEEWLAGPVVTTRTMRQLMRSLKQNGAPKTTLKRGKTGQIVAEVLNSNAYEGLLFAGHRAEIWMQPGKTASQGSIYRGAKKPGQVSLILGAGNVSSIPAMDVLYKLFAENQVAIVKVNPVNEYVGPILEEAFEPLVAAGFLAVAYGSADEGSFLAAHELVDTLHVTGSDQTYDAIVWGPASERARRKQSGERINTKPFTSELGCVTPILVVPGPWSTSDISFQAKHVASMIAQNASFNCNAAKVIVVAKEWLQRNAFLDALDEALANTPARKAYYPGAESRYQAFLDHYPQAKVGGPKGEGVVPWTTIRDVPAKHGEYALTHEAFCGIVAVVSLEEKEPDAFLKEATRFANEDCWGTLSCGIVIHSSTEDRFREAFDQAVASLRYGTIAINAWPGLGYALGTTSWGAFPGHTPEDIQSGTGVVHNSLLFDHPEKSVITAPFRPIAKPGYFSDHKTLDRLGRAMLDHESHPSVASALRVAFAGARG